MELRKIKSAGQFATDLLFALSTVSGGYYLILRAGTLGDSLLWGGISFIFETLIIISAILYSFTFVKKNRAKKRDEEFTGIAGNVLIVISADNNEIKKAEYTLEKLTSLETGMSVSRLLLVENPDDNMHELASKYDVKLSGEGTVSEITGIKSAVYFSNATYLVFLDAGSSLMPNYLNKVLPHFYDKKCAIVYPSVKYNGTGVFTLENILGKAGKFLIFDRLKNIRFDFITDEVDSLSRSFYSGQEVSLSRWNGVIIRRKMLREFLEAEYFPVNEDDKTTVEDNLHEENLAVDLGAENDDEVLTDQSDEQVNDIIDETEQESNVEEESDDLSEENPESEDNILGEDNNPDDDDELETDDSDPDDIIEENEKSADPDTENADDDFKEAEDTTEDDIIEENSEEENNQVEDASTNDVDEIENKEAVTTAEENVNSEKVQILNEKYNPEDYLSLAAMVSNNLSTGVSYISESLVEKEFTGGIKEKVTEEVKFYINSKNIVSNLKSLPVSLSGKLYLIGSLAGFMASFLTYFWGVYLIITHSLNRSLIHEASFLTVFPALGIFILSIEIRNVLYYQSGGLLNRIKRIVLTPFYTKILLSGEKNKFEVTKSIKLTRYLLISLTLTAIFITAIKIPLYIEPRLNTIILLFLGFYLIVFTVSALVFTGFKKELSVEDK